MALERIKKEQALLRKEVAHKTIGYIVTAFGIVAGLAWNEAIKSLIDAFFPKPGNGIFIKFFYAIVITLLVVVVTVYLLKLTQDKKEE